MMLWEAGLLVDMEPVINVGNCGINPDILLT